ncbi:hypothetical protein WJX72_011158 [[Myrmecia] bisecta]|uniref:Uncharacterized protein n=1 Tax=[Myrmecia] bisecta TaxID=41462 RepID=A0AAW1R9L1_9CHLO
MTSPGGTQISSAKKRRLAALEQNLAKRSRPGASAATSHSTPNRTTQPAKRARKSAAAVGSNATPAALVLGGSADTSGVVMPPYDRLCSTIAQGPLAQALQFREVAKGTRVVEDVLDDIMRTNPRALDGRAAVGAKLQDKTLMLDNPVAQLKLAKPQRLSGASLRQQAKKSPLPRKSPLRQCQEKMAQYQLQPGTNQYGYFEPLHQLWQEYIASLLSAARNPEECLLAADLRGCKVKVAQSRNPVHVGKEGIVVKNTKNTFVVITTADRTHALPKVQCIFECRLDKDRVATINGAQYVQATANSRT